MIWKDMLSLLFALAGTIFVIALTYYCSRWYAKRMGPLAGGRHIRVIDRLGVSRTGSILIIEVEGKQYLVGASEGSINLMKELPENLSPLAKREGGSKENLQSFLNILHSKYKKEDMVINGDEKSSSSVER